MLVYSSCNKEYIDNLSIKIDIIESINGKDTTYINAEKKVFVYKIHNFNFSESLSQFFDNYSLISTDGKNVSPNVRVSVDVCGYIHIHGLQRDGYLAVVYCYYGDDYWIGYIGGFNGKINTTNHIHVEFKANEKNSDHFLIK